LRPVVEGLEVVVLGGGLVVWTRTFWMVFPSEVVGGSEDVVVLRGGLVVWMRTSWIRFWEFIVQWL